MVGERFGTLTVIEYLGVFNKNSKWKCRCDCGNITTPFGNNLKKANTKRCRECGHLSQADKKIGNQHGLIHGRYKEKVYVAWNNMKSRCFQKSYRYYKDYGGRGITVCERWMTFENFYADMGDSPNGMSLERINNNGNYEPGNCKWATPREQYYNRRTTRTI